VDFVLRATAERMLEWLEALGLRNVDLLGTSPRRRGGVDDGRSQREHGKRHGCRTAGAGCAANPLVALGAMRIAFFGSSLDGGWPDCSPQHAQFDACRGTSRRRDLKDAPGRALASVGPHVR